MELERFLQGQPRAHVSVRAHAPGLYTVRSQGRWLAWRLQGALKADVVFFPHFDGSLCPPGTPSVVTVHDLTHFRMAGLFSRGRRIAAGMLLRRVTTDAERILVPSKATAHDLGQRLPRTAAKTRVIPEGVDSSFWFPVRGETSAPPYLLCVGNRKPHKNLAAAVEVLARLRAEDPALRLLLVGRRFAGGDRVDERARRLGVQDAVIEVEDASDERLRALYGGAEAFLFPSLHEGFGLPPLEAMACGTPVIASNRSSIPEVVGDAGVLLDPGDVVGMAAAVLRLRADPAWRCSLVERGRRRAESLTWERCAGRTVDALYRVASVSR